MLEIWTAQYRYSGEDRTDITVKSAKYPWNMFAPTWGMVEDYRQTGNRLAYITKYNDIMSHTFTIHEETLWELVTSDRTITLVCFCPPGAFCHRVLLAKHFASVGATYHGERR